MLRIMMIIIVYWCLFDRIQAITEPKMSDAKIPNGQVCVINNDCSSTCCIYATTVSGVCMPKAPIGRVCGFVLGTGSSIEDHYRLCETCDSFCCCGAGCCPTSYCVSALQLKPLVCTKCNTGCCCDEETCCPVPYCAVAPGLNDVQGEPCQRCPSGCCCGETCCLSSFCKGNGIGKFCQKCASGCCCGMLCCAMSFCDQSSMSMTRLLTLYGGLPIFPKPETTIDVAELSFPKPLDLPFSMDGPMSAYLLTLFNGGPDMIAGMETQSGLQQILPRLARVCQECTTGCCCTGVGCCTNSYCVA